MAVQRFSLAMRLPLLAPLLLLASSTSTNAGHAAKTCDYSYVNHAMLQLPHLRLYEESLHRSGDRIHFRACTRNQTTAQVRLNCAGQTVHVSRRAGYWDQESTFLSRQAVAQLCDLYGASKAAPQG